MSKRDIILKLNQFITELEIIKPHYLTISINGVYFYVNKIDYDEIHCRFYLNDILVGGAFFHNIKTLSLTY